MTLQDLRLALRSVPSLRRVVIGTNDVDAVWALRQIVDSVKGQGL